MSKESKKLKVGSGIVMSIEKLQGNLTIFDFRKSKLQGAFEIACKNKKRQ
jgi:hypothetical protein